MRQMQHLKIAGLCLAATLAMGMALAGTASAQPLWLLCLEASTGLTKYADNQCTRAEGSGKFQSLGLPSGTSVTVKLVSFTLRLTDLDAGPLKEKATIICKSEGWGLITPPNTGVITSAKIPNPKTECDRKEGPCKAGELEQIQGVHLPWKTELFETEGSIFAKAEADGSGEPGWSVKCNTLLGSKTDECVSEGAYEEAILLNAISGGVLLIKAKAEKRRKQDCSEGGKASGEVEGQGAILLQNGNGLSITVR
jgi:hypothetical protein